MVHSQLGSNLSPPPSHYTTYLYQKQCLQLKEHPLNEANHHSSFSAMVPSPISPFPLIPTHRYKATRTNGSQREFNSALNTMIFAPNHSKMEDIHGRLNTSKGIWDFSTKNLFQYGETSQPRVSPSLSQSLAYDKHQHVSINPELQGDLSYNDGIGNKSRENDQGFVLSDQEQPKRIQKKNGFQHKDPNQIKGQWTSNEDRVLIQLVDRFGLRKWSRIAKFLKGRVGKQCRERWNNHLRPDIKKDSWTEEEDKILIEAHKIVGNKWAEISRRLPGRTENSIKNHWNATKRRQNAKKKNRGKSSKGILLLKYIMEVTNAKEVEKEPMTYSTSMMDIRNQPNFKSSESDFRTEGLATPENEICGYVPMMFNGDDGMASGSDTTMNYYFGSYGMEFFLEVPLRQEIDLVERIYKNP